MPCACPYCTSSPARSLPVVAKVLTNEFSFWVWVDSCSPMRALIFVRGEDGKVIAKPVQNLDVAARLVAREVFHTRLRPSDESTMEVYVRTAHGEERLFAALQKRLSTTRRKTEPPEGFDCICTRQASPVHRKRPLHAAPVPPRAPPLREGGTTPSRRASVAPVSEAMQISPNGSPNGSPPGPPPSTDAYDLLSRGGDREELANIMQLRPRWDQETVEEVLRWGGRPKLECHELIRGRQKDEVRCTVWHPGGSVVDNIFLPWPVLRAEFASETRHLLASARHGRGR